ncbi:MAG: glycosyltransferase [Acidobacteriota bacterium]
MDDSIPRADSFAKGTLNPELDASAMIPARPWLSVLMPTFNGAAYVADALASVAQECDPGIQCIVVDGGSKDDTLSIVRSFAGRLDLTVLERPDSPNWVWSTNLALAHAAAPHSCLLHQDDLWLPGRTEALRQLMSQAPGAALYVHAARFIDARGRSVGNWTCPWPAAPPAISPEQALPALMVQCFIALPTPVFPTELARAVGGLDETLWYPCDWDFWLKLAARGRVAYCAQSLAAFRVHASAQTVLRSRDGADFLRQLDLVVDRHLGNIQDERLRQRVGRAARFSNRLNTALAQKLHGRDVDWSSLALDALRLGPCGWVRYLRDSRIYARVAARLRAGMYRAQEPKLS